MDFFYLLFLFFEDWMDGAGTSAGSDRWNSGGLSAGRYNLGDISFVCFGVKCFVRKYFQMKSFSRKTA